MHTYFRAAAAVILATSIGAIVQAAEEEDFYSRKSEGWFFYKDRKPAPSPAPAPEVKLPVPVASAPAPAPPPEVKKPEPFSVPWLKEKVEILRNNAIANPTDENVRAYMYAQRLILDMGENFSTAGTRVVESDPYLNEAVRFPIATASRRAALWQIDKAKEAIVKDLAGRAGLWFFFDSSCVHCQSQYPVVKMLEKRFGYRVMYISEDGKPLSGMPAKEFVVDQGRRTFQQLGLKLTPAVVMVSPPDNVMVVAHGSMALDELQAKIAQAAIDKDLVPKELSDIAQLEQRGIITREDVVRLKSDMKDTDDPKELVKMMQAAIGRRMP